MRSVDINRERVLGLIKTATVALTTKEMGRILKVKERSVRAAVGWLVISEYLIPDGYLIAQTTPGKYGKRKFKIKVYKWTGKTDDICKVHTKDLVDREVLDEQLHVTGDVVMLQSLMMGMRR